MKKIATPVKKIFKTLTILAIIASWLFTSFFPLGFQTPQAFAGSVANPNPDGDFSQGVLAVNAGKSIYSPGEEAYLQLGALTEKGNTLCDANLKLEVTNPASQTQTFETANDTIQKSGKCDGNNVTDDPDYFIRYQTGSTGTYQMKLINLDKNTETSSAFEVKDSQPFEIERTAATRINPYVASYEMKIKVKANEDFSGKIVETVPSTFHLENGNPAYSETEIPNNAKTISWDADWKAGETRELTYEYDAADVSPELYFLGPLEFLESRNWFLRLFGADYKTIFQESRPWQIAGDSPGLNLEVPLEMVDFGLESDTSSTRNFARTKMYLTAGASGDYDGSPAYYFEIIAKNTGLANTVTLRDNTTPADIVSITVPLGTSNYTRFRASFSPTSGKIEYLIKIPATPSGVQYVQSARIIVVQTNATKTRIQIPLAQRDFNETGAPATAVSTTTSSSYEQPAGHEYRYSLWKKDPSRYADVPQPPSTPWTLEAAMDVNSGTGYAALFNASTGYQVTGAVVSTASTSIVLLEANFADNATYFDNLNNFEVRIRNSSSVAVRLDGAPRLYMRLANLTAAEIFWRVGRSKPAGTAAVDMVEQRALLNTGAYSHPTTYFEATGYNYNVENLQKVFLRDHGSSVSGTGGTDISGGINFASGSKIRKKIPITVTSGNNFYARTDASTNDLELSHIWVAIWAKDFTANQRAFIFENDDGANVNSNSDMAAANQTISGVKKGGRLEARFQIDNTGSSTTSNQNYKVQYDRQNSGGTWENNWQDLSSGGAPGNTGANFRDWQATTVDSTGDVGTYTSLAIGTDGYPVISYHNATNTELKVTKCNDPACAGQNETITTVDSTGTVGLYSSIAIGTDGYPVISYQDKTAKALKYVHCTSASCSTKDTPVTIDVLGSALYSGGFTSLAIGTDGYPVISYYDDDAKHLKVAKYVNSGGSGCTGATEPTKWICSIADPTANDVGKYTSIAIGTTDGNPVISYYSGENSGVLKVYHCTNASCSTGNAYIVDDPANAVGQFSSIAIGTDGYPVISYYDNTGANLKVAKCNDAACAGQNETITPVDSTGAVGLYTSIAIGTDGYPVVSYYDGVNYDLKVAKCNDAACAGQNETITTVDSTGTVGLYSSIAIGTDGYPVISYFDDLNNDLKVAKMLPITELQTSWGTSGSTGDDLNDSPPAAGACYGSYSWQHGEWHEATGVSQSINLAASYCTELAFMIDTSEAVVGTTYRLRLTWNDGGYLDSYPNYPTFAVVSDSSDKKRYSKEAITVSASTCANSGYNCTAVDSTGDVGSWTSIAIGTDGYPVIAYSDASNTNLKVAKCGNADCSEKTVSTIDNLTSSEDYCTSIAIGTDGYPIISYYDYINDDLKVAKCNDPACSGGDENIKIINGDATVLNYGTSIAIGTDGYPVIAYAMSTTGYLKLIKCNDPACETANAPTNLASDGYVNPSIAIGTDGYPVISYSNGMALKMVKCDSIDCTNKTAYLVDDSAYASYTSIAIGTDGYPVISYYNDGSDDLKVAKCGNASCSSGNTAYTVDSTGTVGLYTSIAIGTDGYPVISYYDAANNYDLKVAKQVASNGNCGGGGWNCITVDSTGDVGQYTSIAIGTDGNPVISYYDAASNYNLKVTKALGLPQTAISYFGNFIRGDKQIKFKSSGEFYQQFLEASAAIEDGLKYWFDEAGYSKVSSDDSTCSTTTCDSMAASANQTPVFSFTEKFSSIPSALYPRWYGQSDVAASANTSINLEVFNFSTNLWQNMISNTTCTASSDCVIKWALTSPPYALSDYFLPRYKYDSQKREKDTTPEYLTFWRVYQVYYQVAGPETLRTNNWTLGLSDTSLIKTRGTVNVRGNALFR